MIDFVNKYARNFTYSQNGEEGLLVEALRRMNITKGVTVEIGGADGRFCSNTALLIERGFSGKFVEAEWPLYLKSVANWAHRKDVVCVCSRVDGHNINAFVHDDCDVLSIDTDGQDFEIFKGLKAKLKIVIVEIDSSIPPDDESFNSDGGASYISMLCLADQKGYFLLAHTGNMIFLDRQYRALFPEIVGNGLDNMDLYFNRNWLKAA